MSDVTVLVVLADGFEEIEALTPVDVLRRAGARVTTACLAPGIHVTGRSSVTVHADCPLASLGDALFDCLVIPGGPAVAALRADGRAAALARRHHEAGKWVAAICAAPTVLKDAGLLEGRRHTAHFSVKAELPLSLGEERVVRDGTLITSRGAGTSLDFALELVEVLFSREERERIRGSIGAF